MWLDEADGFAELLKGYLPYYLLVALPIFIIISPVNPVAASHEFSVHRMHQYDLHSNPHGSHTSSINLEGRSLTTWSTSRHCVVARIQDISIDQFMEIRSKAGALLLVLPKNNTLLTPEQREYIQLLEMAMSQQDVSAPVYFMPWSPEVDNILQDLQHSMVTDDKSKTALEAMLNTVSSNGYQIVVSAPTPQKLESKVVTLHGKLSGRASSGQTILVVAHYDASSVVPDLSQGGDSNASGAVALIELARIFSRLYSVAATRAPPTLLFVLTGTGNTLNYFSAKKWLEDQLDSTDGSLLQDVSFALCLDSISSKPGLSLHVSKPPKPGGPAHSFQSRLGVQSLHKKINLADEVLAWEHERFSIRRITAFTASALQSHKDPSRSSILDTPSEKKLQHLTNNIQDLARALASHFYNITDVEQLEQDLELYGDALNVDSSSISHWYNYLTSQPRSTHITAAMPPSAGVSGALERVLSRYIGEVVTSIHTPDKREPEFTLYSPTRATLNVYSVKPAVFDLILTLAIVVYLVIVYFAMNIFPKFYDGYSKVVIGKVKSN